MKKRNLVNLILTLALLLNAGCYNKRQVQEKPDNLINHNTMVNLIAESYIIESAVHTNTNDTIDKATLTKMYYKELFNRYHVTREQFVTSAEYYIGEETSAEKILSEASEVIIQKRKTMNLPDSVWKQPSATMY